jgi:hypothetical protein
MLSMVWALTHSIYTLFISIGVPVSWIHETFSEAPKRMPIELFERNPAIWFDVAHSQAISREVFLLSGLSYCFGKQSSQFIDDKLRKLIEQEIFPVIDGMPVPSMLLLRDSTLGYNSLDSFMGGDRAEILYNLLEPEQAQIFSSESLHEMATRVINMLFEKRDHLSLWIQLHAVIGYFPPFKQIAEKMKPLIVETDFVDLFKKDTNCGLWALYLAALQLINIGDKTVYEHLKKQMVKTIYYLAGVNSGKQADSADSRIHEILLESALTIAMSVQPSETALPEFVDLLSQLSESRHPIVRLCFPIVQRLYHELPTPQAKEFTTLLLRFRAAKK